MSRGDEVFECVIAGLTRNPVAAASQSVAGLCPGIDDPGFQMDPGSGAGVTLFEPG